MKRTASALILALFLAGLIPAFGAAKAAPTSKPPLVKKKAVTSAVCPVLGTKIPDASKAKDGKMTYKGKTYYFCCPECKAKFQKSPEKYVRKAPTKKE